MEGVIYTQVYDSPLGKLILGDFNHHLVRCDWLYRKHRDSIDNRIKRYFNATLEEAGTEILDQTISQLSSYFKGERRTFDLPILFAGTEFQREVWTELTKVKWGQTLTYGALSKKLNNASAVRAVATANGANALSIIVPCHRIIGHNGSLVGYAGGMHVKKKLLQLEGSLPTSQMEITWSE